MSGGKTDRRRRPPTQEVRAKLSAAMKARLEGEAGKAERERLMRCLEKARQASPGRKRTRPLPGTREALVFKQIANTLGAAAAHAEFRRGA